MSDREPKNRPAYRDVPSLYEPPASIEALHKEIEARKTLTLHQKIAAMIGDCKRIPKNGWNNYNEFAYVTQADTAAMISQLSAKYGVTIISQPIPFPPQLEPLVKSFVDRMNKTEDLAEATYIGNQLIKFIDRWREPQHDEWTDKQDITKMLFEFTVTNADDLKDFFVRYAWGEGLDNGDKSTYKCWSGAEKYFWFKLFQIAADTEPDQGGVQTGEKRRGGDDFDQRPTEEQRKRFERQKETLKPGDENRGHGHETAPATVRPPTVKDVSRDVEIGKGSKAKLVPTPMKNLTGVVVKRSDIATASNKAAYVGIIVAGLPDVKTHAKENHNYFKVWHKHLHDAALTIKPGDNVVFDYIPTVTEKGDRAGVVNQDIEDFIWIGSVEFSNGKPVEPKAENNWELASPTDLFDEK